MQVLFSVLSYHPSFITTESINVGILFQDTQNDRRVFETTSNWRRVKSFDDEIDINYFKVILEGIKSEISNTNIFKYKEKFNIKEYTTFYVNELKFSEVAPAETDSFEDFIIETKKIFLRYDYDKKDRPDDKQQIRYVKELLKSNDVEYSSRNIIGRHNESVYFDYIIDEYAFKMFTFENKRIANQIFYAKSWAYTANELKQQYKTVFIYDIEREGDPEYRAILEILESAAYKVMKLNEAIDFILNLSKKTFPLIKGY